MSATQPSKVDCRHCRHRSGAGFLKTIREEADAISACRTGHFGLRVGNHLALDGLAVVTIYSGYGLAVDATPVAARAIRLLWPGETVACFPHSASGPVRSIRALTDITFCAFEASAWPQIMSHPKLAERLLAILSLQLRSSESMVTALCRLAATGRVCRILGTSYLQLVRRRLVTSLAFDLPLTREDLAGLVGLTPTHLRRTLRHLEEIRVLQFHRGRVELHCLEQVLALGEIDADTVGDEVLF